MRAAEQSFSTESAEVLALLSAVCASPLARHVSSIEAEDQTYETLALLAVRMPQLLCLRGNLWLSNAAPVFPPRICSLRLYVEKYSTVPQQNALISAIGELHSLTSLALDLWYNAELSLAPFSNLPLLRSLQLAWAYASVMPLTDDQVHHIRGLRSLDKIELPMDAPLMLRLIRQPHMAWKQIDTLKAFGDAECSLLHMLPSLTCVASRRFSCGNFTWLISQPNIVCLEVGLSGREHPSPMPASLIAAVQHHAGRLESLALDGHYMHIHAHNLEQFMPRMTALQSLTIRFIDARSLDFLTPLATTLLELHLLSTRGDPLAHAEVEHILALRRLLVLELDRIFAEPLGDIRAQLGLQSARLPDLESVTVTAAL